MEEDRIFKKRGKKLPHLVLRPFAGWFPYKVDSRCYVLAFPSGIALICALFGLMGFFGFAWMIVAIAAKDIADVLIGDFFFLIGGAGSILAYPQKFGVYRIFDRKEGVIRCRYRKKLFSDQFEYHKLPFAECEGRLYRMDHLMRGSIMFGLDIYHPTISGPIFNEEFARRDLALGFWSFLVQYMDKQAPLPDTPQLSQYGNRTKGVGTPEEWKAYKDGPNFIDPLEIWQNREYFDPPEDAQTVYGKYEPRKMPINVDVNPKGRKLYDTIEPRGRQTLLPKKVLRPFLPLNSVHFDEDRHAYMSPKPDNRYYYAAGWVMVCAGIALFAASTAAALITLALAGLYFLVFKKFRYRRGTILDRNNGLVILHQGLGFKPVKLPFDQCEGRLIKTEYVEGFTNYRLYLHHPSHGSFALDYDTTPALDYLLGFWSFVVQYMDKSAPLPETEFSEHFENTSPGMGPWEKWARKSADPGFVDPFAQWLQRIESDSSVDRSEDHSHPTASYWQAT